MFVFIDILFVKQDIKKWLNTKICSFLWRIWKWKEKRTKFFWPSRAGIWTPDFQYFSRPWFEFFTKGEGDEIKSKQASKRDRTLKGSWVSERDYWFWITVPFLYFDILTVRPEVLNRPEKRPNYFWNGSLDMALRWSWHCSRVERLCPFHRCCIWCPAKGPKAHLKSQK